MKVHYCYLDDMERYNKNFDRKLYENREEEEVIEEFRQYYANRLPIDLLTWTRVNKPKDEMIWKEGFSEQVVFIRDRVNSIFYPSYEEFKANPVMVINTHRSKSISLPVYEINLKKYGVKMILRDNFYDWKVSVCSDNPIITDFMGLFDENETIESWYCEGFAEEQVYGSYSKDKMNFTVSIKTKYELFTFMHLLNSYLKRLITFSKPKEESR